MDSTKALLLESYLVLMAEKLVPPAVDKAEKVVPPAVDKADVTRQT